MAKSVNRVTLLGNVGKDPEQKITNSGMMIVNFSLATSSKKKGQSGEYEEVTQWHNCVAFGKLAEIVSKYVRKGTKLYADGALDYQVVDKEGVRTYYTKIIINDISLLSGNQDSPNQPLAAPINHTMSNERPYQHQDNFDDNVPF